MGTSHQGRLNVCWSRKHLGRNLGQQLVWLIVNCSNYEAVLRRPAPGFQVPQYSICKEVAISVSKPVLLVSFFPHLFFLHFSDNLPSSCLILRWLQSMGRACPWCFSICACVLFTAVKPAWRMSIVLVFFMLFYKFLISHYFTKPFSSEHCVSFLYCLYWMFPKLFLIFLPLKHMKPGERFSINYLTASKMF